MFSGGCLLVNDLASKKFPGMYGGGNAGAEVNIPGVNSESISDIVDSSGEAVVKISTTKASKASDPFYDDPFFRYFFGNPPPEREQLQPSIGSGFIISEDGLVITNEHVISGANEIQVTIGAEDEKYAATVVGSDYDLDLAVLKIQEADNLSYLKMADSDNVKVGNWVIAIGNPFGFDHTVTVGVISAKGRPITVENRHYKNLIQTDAAINPGNSGGPLLNLQGEVIGINTAVAQAQGIGFAIPTNTVKDVLEELLSGGRVAHPWLGVQMRDLTPELAEHFGLPDLNGVVVQGVIPGSPAERAGLRQMDVILELQGIKIENSSELAATVKEQKIGEDADMKIIRNGRMYNVSFIVGENPSRLR